MLDLGSVVFSAPWMLAALAVLPVLWWLLRVMPPAPLVRIFPPLSFLLALRSDLATSLGGDRKSEPLPRYARVVMISDFLSPPNDVARSLRNLASLGVRGHLLQIVDPAEETLPFSGRVRFEGLEGEGATLIGRVEAVRDEYVALMANHRRAVSDVARGLGWTSTTHSTEQPPTTALLSLYEVLSEMPGA